MDADLILIPVLILSLGGMGIMLGAYSLAKQTSILGLIVCCLFVCVASATLASLTSKGLVDPEWIFVGLNAWCGILLTLPSIASLYSPPPQKAPGLTQWVQLLAATVLVVSAIERGWYHYRH